MLAGPPADPDTVDEGIMISAPHPFDELVLDGHSSFRLAHAALLWALAVASVFFFAWLLRRTLQPALERAGVRPPGESPSQFYYHRLLRALARRGFHKRSAETPLEFAGAVVRRGGADYAALLRVTALLYRSRFGAVPLDSSEKRFIEGFIKQVRAARR